jgi:hypothetical protein
MGFITRPQLEALAQKMSPDFKEYLLNVLKMETA